MSLQVATGAGSLVAIGLGAGDISSLVSLSKTIGNWWSAASGDEEFLHMLNEDEFNILKRKGLMEMSMFNKIWRNKMRLLARGGETLSIEGKQARDATNDLSRFTASMVCIVATLDQFASTDLVKEILRNTLKILLETTEHAEDYLRAQYPVRLNAWRSTATLHGLSNEANEVKQELLLCEAVLGGTIPFGEMYEITTFLVWLLAGQDEEFTTSSSDIAGIAACLSRLGMDGLSVHGLGQDPAHTRCRLLYTPIAFLQRQGNSFDSFAKAYLARAASTIVPIDHPEECMSIFPVKASVQNRCRTAWKAGKLAAAFVASGVGVDNSKSSEGVYTRKRRIDLIYGFSDRGSPESRISEELYNIAKEHAFVLNEELFQGLRDCLGQEKPEVLKWVCHQTLGGGLDTYEITDRSFNDMTKITAFTVFQSFFMGYYYEIFFRMVDTSSLHLQIVDGAWGYRAPEVLFRMRTRLRLHQPFSRHTILVTLCDLFLGQLTDMDIIEGTESVTACVGIIAKRTLLANSLMGKCSTPSQVGSFTLIDVDVGGVPRDASGLVRCGVPDALDNTEFVRAPTPDGMEVEVIERAPQEDVSLHIEPDWEGNSNTALLCIRFKGRRVTTISPGIVDGSFVRCYVPPIERDSTDKDRETLPKMLTADISTWLEKRTVLLPRNANMPLLFQALNCPRLRYAAVGIYDGYCAPNVASNSILSAVEQGERAAKKFRESARSARLTVKDVTVIIGSAPSVDHSYRLLEWSFSSNVNLYEIS